MPIFNLLNKRKEMLKMFNSLNFKNVNEVLEWFFMAKDYDSLFLDDSNVTNIVNTLKRNGYKDTMIPNTEYLSFITSKEVKDKENIGKMLISQIINDITVGGSITSAIKYFIGLYINKFTNEKSKDFMFNKLIASLGKNVVLVAYNGNTSILKTGILREVIPESFVIVSDQEIPINEILRITDSNGNVLYEKYEIFENKNGYDDKSKIL